MSIACRLLPTWGLAWACLPLAAFAGDVRPLPPVNSLPAAQPVLSAPAPCKAAEKASEKKKPAAPPQPYKLLSFDNDFSYLDDPQNKEHYFGDRWKRMHLGCEAIMELGGEYRLRYQHENNFRGSRLDGRDDDFLLQRTRLYADLKLGDWFRYAEAIDATSSFEDFPPRTIEENRFDALNLFADGLLFDDCGGKLWGRVGRQEMAYGAERLISPLDWANTRRTFDGAKLFWRGQDWHVDAFGTRPVPFDQHVDNDHNFDHPDQSQEFLGLYSTYKGVQDQSFDFYYLRLAEYDSPGTAANPVDFDVNTFGTRWLGKHGPWLWEIEGGYQFGEFAALDDSAGFCTVGGGHEWSCHAWKPTLWVYYDWASGDADPTDGTHGTFNQLFPLAHKYFGFMDLVARQNIRDLNFLFTCQPDKKLKFLIWWHIFHLDQARDALYNAAGVPIRFSPSGAAGRDVGQELDLLLTVTMTPRAEVQFGYSHFFAGDFIQATNPAGVSGDADFFYSQLYLRF